MVTLNTFEQFLTTQPTQINIFDIVFALLLAALMAFILGKIYVRYGRALSNRRKFSSNFILLATTTTLIIAIVKSSLALSLGLVGALSIVRFRAAIKEPEELAVLFLTIGIGLGLGANQWVITSIAFVIICLLIVMTGTFSSKLDNQNLVLTVSSRDSKKITLKQITQVLMKHCSTVHLKRFDEADQIMEAVFYVDFRSFARLERAKKEIESISKSVSISYLDKSGLN